MRTRNLLYGALAVVLLAVGGYAVTARNTDTANTEVAATASPSATPLQAAEVTGVAGKTALASFQENFTVVTKSTSFGDMVTTINGREATGNAYWQFFIDGVSANEGAGTYVAKGGEKLEFRFTE